MSDKDHQHESCENCKFFNEFEHVDMGHLEGMFTRSGNCKRYPPVAVVNNFSDGLECATTIEHEQTVTSVDGWCGEWKQ